MIPEWTSQHYLLYVILRSLSGFQTFMITRIPFFSSSFRLFSILMLVVLWRPVVFALHKFRTRSKVESSDRKISSSPVFWDVKMEIQHYGSLTMHGIQAKHLFTVSCWTRLYTYSKCIPPSWSFPTCYKYMLQFSLNNKTPILLCPTL